MILYLVSELLISHQTALSLRKTYCGFSRPDHSAISVEVVLETEAGDRKTFSETNAIRQTNGW